MHPLPLYNKRMSCLLPLTVLYIVFMIASQTLSYRYVSIGPILTVSSVFVIPFTYSIADLIAEVYGYTTMRNVIWLMLVVLGIYAIVMFVLTDLPQKESFAKFNTGYTSVFHPIVRIYLSNFIAVLLGMFLNTYILVKWKALVKGRIFYIRSVLSSSAGELIFTAVVISLVQVGVMPFKAILEMIAVSFCIKITFTLVSAFIVFFLKPFVMYTEARNAALEQNR